MPDKSKYDLDFRPKSYWMQDARKAVLSRIKGAARRQTAELLLEEGMVPAADDPFFAESLSEGERQLSGSIHPAMMGGEYLPDFEDGEVEIARVELESTTGDVTSLRARRGKGSIRYRMVDEYFDSPLGTYSFRPRSSREPLTLRRLIALLDGVRLIQDGGEDVDFSPRGFRRTVEDPVEAARFVRVTSGFYPGLRRWYEEEAEEGPEE